MTIRECNKLVQNALRIIENEEANILGGMSGDMVRIEKDRLFSGKKSDGTPIAPEYSAFTKAAKSRKGQQTDRVTLYDTGEFYSTFFANVSNDVVIFGATSGKTSSLEERYGETIFGLGKDGRKTISDKVVRRLVIWFKEQTKL